MTDPKPKTEYLSWFSPGIADATDHPDGLWVIGDEPGQVGAILAPGPAQAGADWLAPRYGCLTTSLARAPNVDLGIYAVREGRLDYDRIERWISVPVWIVTSSKPSAEERWRSG
ncbi:hypothetical protein ACIQUM_36360 [Amycolatopsis azurea]|uniref:hypothetical protein n=1 Tax=Amycolatopsis azurea TaxID=36819 RepID=UPI003805DD6F